MKALVLVPNYLPGFRAGGPVRSVANLVEALGDEIQFHIVTRDRDRGCRRRYESIARERWQSVGKAQVAYVPPLRRPSLRLRQLARDVRPDVLYVNGFFNHRCCAGPLALVRAGLMRPGGIVIAPHGEFSEAALAIRAWKKAPYLAAVKSSGLLRRVVWHATSAPEQQDILREMGASACVELATNLCDRSPFSPPARAAKEAGQLKLAYVARIVPNKNLLGALNVLEGVHSHITLDVWGPVEDQAYWQRCLARIAELPRNIRVNCRGVAPPDEVRPLLAGYDALLFPTHTENFGYVIAEALSAGCPVVISDRTPWRALQRQGVGWDLPLGANEAFTRTLERLAAMDDSAHARLRRQSLDYGRRQANDAQAITRYRELFQLAIGKATRPVWEDSANRRAA